MLALALACSGADDASESRFVRLAENAVRDTRTANMWTARDAGRELSWLDAEAYCRALTVEGVEGDGAAWRLPSAEELVALYDPSTEQPCGEVTCRVDPAIQLSSPYQWTATEPAPNRRTYQDFALGSQLSPLIQPMLTRRALCVRSGEQDAR